MSGTIVLPISGRLTRADIAPLCDRLRQRLEPGHITVVICDLCEVVDPDSVTLEALARLALTVRRFGGRLELRYVSRRVQDLVVLVGLVEVLGLELEGQPEEREHPLGVEEVVQPDDPPL
jgi:ABC-type transporter Mla MlaB component